MGAAFGWGLLAASSLPPRRLLVLRVRIGDRLLGLIMAFGAGADQRGCLRARRRGVHDQPWRGPRLGLALPGPRVLHRRRDHRSHGWLGPKAWTESRRPARHLRSCSASSSTASRSRRSSASPLLQGGASAPRCSSRCSSRTFPRPSRRRPACERRVGERATFSPPARRHARVRPRFSAGYGLFDDASPNTIAFVLSFAAGAILTMLADTMMPEAYARGGKLVGLATTLGFGLAFAISTPRIAGTKDDPRRARWRPSVSAAFSGAPRGSKAVSRSGRTASTTSPVREHASSWKASDSETVGVSQAAPAGAVASGRSSRPFRGGRGLQRRRPHHYSELWAR